MNFFNKLFNKFVYLNTVKPQHYIHVDKPKTLQDHRQIQYNKWCKRYGVYNGSYLPKECDTLHRKGWIETKRYDSKRRFFQRKSSGQRVRLDLENIDQIEHYHWINPKPTKKHRLKLEYLDRYGNPCSKKDQGHHLAPLDKDCPYNAYKSNKKKGKKR